MKREKMARFLVLAIGLLVILGGCKRRQEEAQPEKQRLVIWHYWESASGRQALRQMIARYNQENPEVEVVLEYIPDEDFKKRLALGMADGQMPELAIVDSSDVQYFQAAGHLADVSGLVDREAYLDQAIASCEAEDGSLSGIPIGVNCLVLLYNEDLLQAKGIPVPSTMDEFVQASVLLSGDGVYGCAFPALQSEESMFCFLPILWTVGGSVTDIDTAQGEQAFDILRRLSGQGAMSQQTVNMTLGDVAREFQKGKVAMMFATTMTYMDMEKAGLDFSFDFAPLPSAGEPTSIVGGEVLVVTDGPYQEEARKFLQYMADPDSIRSYIRDTGCLAPRGDVLSWQVQGDPVQERFWDILKTARTRDFSAEWPMISLAFSDAISKVILHEDTPELREELAETVRRIREDGQ